MSAARHTPGPWKVEPPKQADIPISAIGLYGERIIVARVPFTSKIDAPSVAAMIAASPAANDALRLCERLFAEALPKFDWGASALDANAIRLLNEVPAAVRAALAGAGS